MPLLEQNGYSLQQGERGWELVDSKGHIALVASDSLTVTTHAIEGEILVLPAERFEVRETIGAGVPIVLTFKDPAQVGEVAYLYLDRSGEWVIPLALQTNPRETENYTHTTLDDFLTGRVLYSELLQTSAFPAEAIRPDRYEYAFYAYGGITDYDVLLYAVINGNRDNSLDYRYSPDFVMAHDFIRQAFFYTLDTPEGVRAVIHTQQQLDPEGNVLSFHLAHGPDKPLAGEWVRTGHGYQFNLLNSVFLARSEQPPEGFSGYTTPPVIHSERRPNYDDTDWGMRFNMGAREVRNLSLIPENNLMNIDALGAKIRHTWENWDPSQVPNDGTGAVAVVVAGEELYEAQFKVISGTISQGIPPESEYYRP